MIHKCRALKYTNLWHFGNFREFWKMHPILFSAYISLSTSFSSVIQCHCFQCYIMWTLTNLFKLILFKLSSVIVFNVFTLTNLFANSSTLSKSPCTPFTVAQQWYAMRCNGKCGRSSEFCQTFTLTTSSSCLLSLSLFLKTHHFVVESQVIDNASSSQGEQLSSK